MYSDDFCSLFLVVFVCFAIFDLSTAKIYSAIILDQQLEANISEQLTCYYLDSLELHLPRIFSLFFPIESSTICSLS